MNVSANSTPPASSTPSVPTAAVSGEDPIDLETTGTFPIAIFCISLFSCESRQVREVGEAAVWSVSSCKPGFGVDQLRDNCLDTYWQSDGPQPHLVNIQFHKKTLVENVCIYADYKSDESYTPSRISVRTGTHFNDLQEVEVVELLEPSGWVNISLGNSNGGRPVKAFMVQIAVLSNHQNGRDTHMRQVRVHAPGVSLAKAVHETLPCFTTNDYVRQLYPR
ncbi:unnamed protein product [Notodromas monacha]|uniref:Anaphase-promoting complex subunit 10 n=1 Tax=Notodromas monacha TaxID=399045 RepID=A0A7R9BJW6_9CRUS|nr:unnamed protein product [Notodromas monacha]CAG0915500.1 unnamed protein product [Notodromas monacha]